MTRRATLLLAVIIFSVTSSAALGELKLPSVIGSHMVLQRDQPVPLWGWEEPGTTVTATLGDTQRSAVAKADGHWMIELPAMPAGGPHQLKLAGSSEVVLDDVLFGEVWLCSGQSNMEWNVARSMNAEEEIAAANHPNIRHIKILRQPAREPQRDVPSSGWKVCGPDSVAGFTAVGYFFARHLQEELDVPIGLIGSNWGGTRIEPWTAPEGFRGVKQLSDIADRLDDYPTVAADGKVSHQSPLALYNGMIHPLVPYGIRGAIWYQGEANRRDGMLYRHKMKALIEGWRKVWGRLDLPFHFVQLAPYRYDESALVLPGIWEAQQKTLSIENTGMAVTVDVGNVDDIHPTNKQAVGKRLALWALAKNYGQGDIVYSGPLFESMAVEGDSIRLNFEHVGSGLVSRDGKPLSWFFVAGRDNIFVEADARIDGDTVVVSSPTVAEPVAVRFGWHEEAEPNLSNKEGLPASPFRAKQEADGKKLAEASE